MIVLGKTTEITKIYKCVGKPDHLLVPDIFVEH